MARALLIAGDRNIRRWEDGHHPVSGPAWVALEGMLRGKGQTTLAYRVTEVIEQRRCKRQTQPPGEPRQALAK